MEVTLRSLLDLVIEKNASDLHLGVGVAPMMRIDGVLGAVRDTMPMAFEEVERALLEVISPEQYKKFMETHELDFSFSHVGSGVEARFRGNCYCEMRGIAAAFRLIPMKIRTLQELALPQELEEVAHRRRGLFLVTGPTGHGKSTTLAALVDEINRTRFDHIVTIEDPIEYVHQSQNCVVHQREVGSDTFSFAEALKHVLRQDPDVILIGELRDLETIQAAITAAETGHLVLGTLHTQDAPQSVDRLIDVFPPHQQAQIRIQLASVLVGICSQQLIPRGGGGRICATELLIANPGIRNCIREGKTSQIRTAIQTGAATGMHTMEQCLADLVGDGILSRDAALAYAYDPKELQRVMTQGAV
ncbi:type IV pilus twitching motility protein PilT [uncultured Fretibacterium sp.]|uniref:type IV pilus twitching motility protein PilT n=1 Tax=uncultured Fretibacterium sp. TaxID=1678694 RepID=UPI002626010E|nr:type IV pilus twitching motility protein PilT [uncultured Fretibacterium sp.]